MTKLLLNEYYRWSYLDVIHMFLALGTIYLSYVVFAEPVSLLLAASCMTITFFFIKVQSRLAYILNVISTGVFAWMLYSIGLHISASFFGVFLLPAGIVAAYYIYRHQIYVEDYANHIKNRGFLSNTAFFTILITVISMLLGVWYLNMIFPMVSIYPIYDMSYALSYALSIGLVYYEKYEHTITHILSDVLFLMLWVTCMASMGFGMSMIIVGVLTFGYSRLLLVWWVTKAATP